MSEYVNRIQNIYCDKCEDEECLECNAIGIAKSIENEIRADERAKAYEEYSEEVLTRFCAYCNQESCEGGMIGSIQECQTISTLRDIVNELENQFK